MQAPLSHCRKLLRTHDYPRYLLSLTLPSPQREQLWALGALNVEVSRAAEMSEPATAAIRLKWWLEALDQPRQHPVVEALRAYNFNTPLLIAAIEAREVELEKGFWFADMKALDAYATATGGFWAALARDEAEAEWLASLGQLWALQGLLWATGYHLSQGRCTLPQEVVVTHGINPLEPQGDITPQLEHIITALARRIEESLKRLQMPKEALLARAVPVIRWRARKMQQSPQVALTQNPPESRLGLLWQMMFARQS